MTRGVEFKIAATDGAARTGTLALPRGVVRTPAFMPVGTAGTVKAMTMDWVKATGADIILGNTYHLMLRPGAERVAALGGLHEFSRWQGPILTDSGGFQVMSLAQLRKLDETGVTFQSHIDGTTFSLTPERAMEIQALLDSRYSHAAGRMPAPAGAARRRWSAPCGCRCAGRSAPRRRSARRRGGRCSASYRAAMCRR